MQIRNWIGFLVLGLLFAACAPTPTAAPFNFPKGATWTYAGMVKWEEQGKAQEKTLTWKMHVVDKIERSDGIVGYVMQGHPSDLAFYSADKTPDDFLYIVKANRVYAITLVDVQPIARVEDKNDTLTDWLTADALAYDFPLAANKSFGAGQNGMNVWMVTETRAAKLTGIHGVAPADATEAVLNFKTNPDWQTVYFVPGVGITRYVYHHNGTLSDVDVKLVEYAHP